MATDNEKLWVVRKRGRESSRTAKLYVFRTRQAGMDFARDMAARYPRSIFTKPIPATWGPEQ